MKVDWEELLARKISYFNDCFQTVRKNDIHLSDLIRIVSKDKHKDLINQIRKEKDKTIRNKLKTRLPAVTISGIGNRGKSSKSHEMSVGNIDWKHSGLLQLDFDLPDNPDFDADQITECLWNDPHCITSFLSPSGGVKAIAAIPEDIYTHKASSLAAKEYYYNEFDLKIDDSPKNFRSLCYLSYDSEIYIREESVCMFEPLNDTQNTVIQSHSYTVSQDTVYSNTEEYICGSVSIVSPALHLEQIELNWMNDPNSDTQEVKLWEKFVHDRYEPDFSKRNKILCNFVAYSFSRMCQENTYTLSKVMRTLWDSICNDPMDQHLRETKSLWEGCENTFMNSITKTERDIYQVLQIEDNRATFRVCRDLASETSRCKILGGFFLSARELGIRLSLTPMKAWKIIRKFKKFKIIKETKNGTRGSNGKASEFVWLLHDFSELQEKHESIFDL
jgi:hypothetical protein